MSRKRITRRLRPLPKNPFSGKVENKTELLTELLRGFARSSQAAETLLFYSQQRVAQKYAVPASLVAKIYRTLEEEGLLRPKRGSGTLLEGTGTVPRTTVRGLVAIVISLVQFRSEQGDQNFFMEMERELERRNVVAASAFFAWNETADELAERLKRNHPDRIIWYSPPKLAKEVALRMRDIGIAITGIADIGFPAIPCPYEIRRWRALRKIVGEWKKETALTRVRVALGPARSAAEEATIGRTLEEMDVEVRFIRLGSQTIGQFIDALARKPTFGTVLSQSAAAVLAMSAPEAFARLAQYSRLALVGGPVSVPRGEFAEATADMVIVDWNAVARRVVGHFLKRTLPTREEPCVFEATAECRISLSLYSQRV